MSQDYTWPRLRSTSSSSLVSVVNYSKAVLFKAPQDNRNTEIMFTIVEQLLLFVCCVPHIVHVSAQNASITIPPRAVNVSVNEVAEFNCTAVANTFTWQTNGQQIDEGDVVKITNALVNRTQKIRISTLKLTVTSIDDTTNITCSATLAIRISLMEPPVLSISDSDPVLLLVQGLLDSVSNLTVVPINSTTVLISWSPPLTLEVLSYNVTITNTTSGENEILERENTTALYYMFSIDNPDPDNIFTVTVVPIIVGARKVSKKFSVKEVVGSSSESAPSITPTPVTSVATSDIVTTVMPSIVPNSPLPISTLIAIIAAGVIIILVITAVVLIIACAYKQKHKKPSIYKKEQNSELKETEIPTTVSAKNPEGKHDNIIESDSAETGDNDTKFGNLVAEELRKIMDATKKEDVKSQIKNVLKIKEA